MTMDDDKRDPPIEEQAFIAGLTVVDFGDYRVARGFTRRAYSGCGHKRVAYDPRERRIWCRDCERDVDPFDAFVQIAEAYSQVYNSIVAREKAISELEQFKIRSIAVRHLDEAWRKQKMVPACPNCGGGLFPEDFKHGVPAMLGKEYAMALRRRKKDGV